MLKIKLVAALPKSWLIHDITYSEFTGRNAFGDYEYAEPIQISNVRYDKISTLTSSNVERSNPITGVVYIDARNSINMPNNFVEQSKVVFGKDELTIVKVIPCYHPEANVVHHYEVEVS